jgi:cytochrome c oxidase subunit 1
MQSITRTEFVAQPTGPTFERRPWIFKRPVTSTGWVGWLTTVDHKRIGILYAISGLLFFLVGGFEALLIRIQLAVPNNTFLSHQTYNELFTMHGTTMIFLAIMPLGSAAFNYIMPLQIGARDVAFPRLNAFAYWLFLAGALIVNAGWFQRTGPPDMGWYGYAPLTSRAFSNQFAADYSTDYWIFGLQILGASSIIGSVNFIVTIINLRAPGMALMRMPVFSWMTLVTAFLVILAFPAITIALVELMMDRYFDTGFFEVSMGGLPILWQHLFWVFGHPEVYILILPAMGIISEIIPTFARKPLFGYPVVVFSGACIGFLGFGVWAHHMFATGLGNVGVAAFALATMAIAVPTGVKIFNWIGTLWGGHLRIRTPMIFALGFIWMFMIGGFSGVMHSAAPADTQQNDTYFVVAHFHYVLIGGSLFALLAGIHYWFPLVRGRRVSDFWGKLAFWIIFVGFNTTFFPMHFLGLGGMPRRTAVYDGNMGLTTWNFISSIGAFILGIGIALYMAVLVYTWFKGEKTTRDPWDARTLEWSIPTPPPAHNFDTIPTVHARDELWYQKTHAQQIEQESRDHAREEAEQGGIHMPSQSWFPLITAFGICLGGMSAAHHFLAGALTGVLILLAGAILWSLEGPGGYILKPKQRDES